jgi:hypothetical protein
MKVPLIAASSVILTPDIAVVPGILWNDSPNSNPSGGG